MRTPTLPSPSLSLSSPVAPTPQNPQSPCGLPFRAHTARKLTSWCTQARGPARGGCRLSPVLYKRQVAGKGVERPGSREQTGIAPFRAPPPPVAGRGVPATAERRRWAAGGRGPRPLGRRNGARRGGAMDPDGLEDEEEITASKLRARPRPLPISALSAFSYVPPRRTDPKEYSYYYRQCQVRGRGGRARGPRGVRLRGLGGALAGVRRPGGLTWDRPR